MKKPVNSNEKQPILPSKLNLTHNLSAKNRQREGSGAGKKLDESASTAPQHNA